MQILLDQRKATETFLNRHSSNPGVTFAGCYGTQQKPSEFVNYTDFIADQLKSLLGQWIERDWLRLTPKEQIHITGVGFEGTQARSEIKNKNLADRLRASESEPDVPAVDIEGSVEFLRELPAMVVQFGGYSPYVVNPYDRRLPYRRSFEIRSDGLIVGIGWPVAFGPALLVLRDAVEMFNVVHKYHIKIDCTKDNDGFVVLGEITDGPWKKEGSVANAERKDFFSDLWNAQKAVRKTLSARIFPVHLETDHWSIIQYPSTDLKFPDSKVFSIASLTGAQLFDLYQC